jgi:hypothetical protein
MTGGRFSSHASDFLASIPNRCVDKPRDATQIRRLVVQLAAE